jgi:hypothetical protein
VRQPRVKGAVPRRPGGAIAENNEGSACRGGVVFGGRPAPRALGFLGPRRRAVGRRGPGPGPGGGTDAGRLRAQGAMVPTMVRASCGGLPGPATRRAAGDPEPDAIGCAARGTGQTGKPRPGVPAWAAGLRLRGRRWGLVRRMRARGARVSRRRETTGRFQAFDLLLAQATKGRTREDFGPGRAPRRGAGPGARARIAASGARPDHRPPDRTGRRPTQAPPPHPAPEPPAETNGWGIHPRPANSSPRSET